MPGFIILHSDYHNNVISNFKLKQSDKASSYLMLVEKTSYHTCRETYHSIVKEENASLVWVASYLLLNYFWKCNHLSKTWLYIPDTFLSLLPLGGDIKVGIIDYIIKTLGDALTFGLLAIALRGKFERNIHGGHKGYVIIATSYFSCS